MLRYLTKCVLLGVMTVILLCGCSAIRSAAQELSVGEATTSEDGNAQEWNEVSNNGQINQEEVEPSEGTMSNEGYVNNSNAQPSQAMAMNNGSTSQSKRFIYRDKQSGLDVMAFTMPANWQASGNSTWHPSGACNQVIWFVDFRDPKTGAVARFSSQSLHQGMGTLQQQPMLQNPAIMAETCRGSIQAMLPNSGNVNISNLSFAPTSDSYVMNIVAVAKKAIPNSQFYPREMSATLSFNNGGQPWSGKLHAFLICYEMRTMQLCASYVLFVENTLELYPQSVAAASSQSFRKIFASRAINNKWDQYLSQLNVQKSQQEIQRQNQATQQQIRHGQEISDIQRQAAANRSATQDRVNRARSESILGETEVSNPYNSGSSVVTDNNSNHAWTNSNNEVINTDSTMYNPNTDGNYNSSDWTQVK